MRVVRAKLDFTGLVRQLEDVNSEDVADRGVEQLDASISEGWLQGLTAFKEGPLCVKGRPLGQLRVTGFSYGTT